MQDTPKEAATGDKAARDLMLSELLQVCTPAPWSFAPKIGECWSINDAEGVSLMGDETYYPWTPNDINDWKLIALAPTIAAELIKERAVNAKLLEACKKALNALKGREHDQFLRDAIAKAEGKQS